MIEQEQVQGFWRTCCSPLSTRANPWAGKYVLMRKGIWLVYVFYHRPASLYVFVWQPALCVYMAACFLCLYGSLLMCLYGSLLYVFIWQPSLCVYMAACFMCLYGSLHYAFRWQPAHVCWLYHGAFIGCLYDSHCLWDYRDHQCFYESWQLHVCGCTFRMDCHPYCLS